MRFKFTLYPDARQKLAEHGLDKRIEAECKKEDFPSTLGSMFSDEFRSLTGNMKARGFYKNAPKNVDAVYYDPLTAFAKNVDKGKRFWNVKYLEREMRERAENEDFFLLSGFLASCVLKPKEFWDPQRFGFSSLSALHGAIGAYVWGVQHSYEYRAGHVWESTVNGKTFQTQVTGDTNGDFRFFRNDHTPYETTDPLGNRVEYRPEFTADHQSVAAYHSVEPSLLVGVLKYVSQEKIPAKNLTKKGLDAIAAELIPGEGGLPNYADFGMGNSPMVQFAGFSAPMPRIDQEVRWNPYRLISNSGGNFAMYVGREKELVFQYESEGGKKEIALTLPANEIDQLIKGIFVQTHGALGRTSIRQVIDLLNYYFSPEFETDQKSA